MAPISRTVALFVACAGSADALVPSRWTPSSARATAAPRGRGSSVVVNMGLFDGLKEAFNPDAESQAIDEDRETPFDRWMGISTKREEAAAETKTAFVDSMAEANYQNVALSKPMGVVFEENDPSTGGVFIASLADGGAAAVEGSLKTGDQLVAVNGVSVRGLSFDDCLSKIVGVEGSTVSLLCFRGGVGNLYGNLGPSDEWLSEFLDKVKPAAAAPAPAAEPVAAE
eukprot:CAMPEP_0119468016 /NCGR_PEP_ID=MMETSP1344-20130328/1955_1 /TAXON_ID=236787 /ORGANISM="Florenciella parvula, Strain CCMP2471" /LENGTH=226 /DNA_ID=CAMNT_0007500447 /DNA_START=65 /DNA_END=745 /DNA_ORIENTATION=+